MKKLLLAGLFALSFNAFSQSYIIMDNGMVLTTDNAGFVYDIGEYSFPQKVTMKGGQFYVEDNQILATVDEMGTLYRKYEVIPEKIMGKGINYYLSSTGELTTIDSKGAAHTTMNEAFTRAVNFGGNYFTVNATADASMIDLYTIAKSGEVKKAEFGDTLKMKDVVAFGGSYFMTNRGIVYTISADGSVLSQAKTRVGLLQKRGGNYFTDSSGLFFTVAEDGSLVLPGIPLGLKVNTMTKLGTNYFLDLSGKLYTVDKLGNVYEKVVRDQDFRNARIISL